MIRSIRLGRNLPLLLVAFVLSGCQPTPATTQPAGTFDAVNSAAISWQLVLDSIEAAENAGIITTADVTPFDPELNAVKAAFLSYQANPSDPNAGTALLNAVNAALPQLAPLLAKSKPTAAVHSATTKASK